MGRILFCSGEQTTNNSIVCMYGTAFHKLEFYENCKEKIMKLKIINELDKNSTL